MIEVAFCTGKTICCPSIKETQKKNVGGGILSTYILIQKLLLSWARPLMRGLPPQRGALGSGGNHAGLFAVVHLDGSENEGGGQGLGERWQCTQIVASPTSSPSWLWKNRIPCQSWGATPLAWTLPRQQTETDRSTFSCLSPAGETQPAERDANGLYGLCRRKTHSPRKCKSDVHERRNSQNAAKAKTPHSRAWLLCISGQWNTTSGYRHTGTWRRLEINRPQL